MSDNTCFDPLQLTTDF